MRGETGTEETNCMNIMKNLFTLLTLLLLTLVACSNDSAVDEKPDNGGTYVPGNLPVQNVARAIELIDNAVEYYFTGTGMAMSRYYNPYTGNRSSELGSVWMYTSSIEAVNAAMKAMKTGKTKGETALYDSHFNLLYADQTVDGIRRKPRQRQGSCTSGRYPQCLR